MIMVKTQASNLGYLFVLNAIFLEKFSEKFPGPQNTVLAPIG